MGRPQRVRAGPPDSLRRAAQELIWLYDFRKGVGPREIAARDHVPLRRVKEGLGRARAMEPPPAGPASLLESVAAAIEVIPLFPVGLLSPSSPCPHHGPIRAGSRLYCVVCHQTGFEAPPTDPESSAPAASRPRPEPRPRRTGVA